MTLEELFYVLGAALYEGVSPLSKVKVFSSEYMEEDLESVVANVGSGEVAVVFSAYPLQAKQPYPDQKIIWGQTVQLGNLQAP